MYIIILLLSCLSSNKMKLDDLDSSEMTQYEEDNYSEEVCGYKEGNTICNIASKDQFLNTFDLHQNEGKVIVIDFSTMWCGYCQVSAPIGNSMYLELKNEGFEWVTILIEDSQGNIPDLYDQQVWAGTFELDHSVLSGSRSEYIDYNNENGFSITSWPTFYVVDKNLEIAYIQKGWGETPIRNVVDQLLLE